MFTNAKGYLWYPRALAIDSAGNVYVADAGHGMVQKFTHDGKLVDQAAEYRMGTGGPKSKLSNRADGHTVTIDNKGHLYTSGARLDYSSNREAKSSYISKFVPGDIADANDELPVYSTLEAQYSIFLVIGPPN